MTPYNAKDFNREVDSTDDENDLEAKNFIPGEKIIDSPEKTQAILKALAEAESSAGNDFKILEAVVTENHVHAVIYLSEESAGISKALNLLKGISARRFFESFPNLANAQNPANPTVNQNPTSPTVNQNPTSPTVNQNPTNPIVNQNPTSPTVNGGVIEDRVNSEKNKNDKSRFNHLWRKGYHFSCLSKYTEYEGAMDYVEKHAGKAKVAEFYSKLPVTFRVFTTRPDTLFGATYTVFAPEAELVQRLQSQIKNWQEVEKYIDEAAKKSDLERTELAKDKTGVELKGVKAVNPVNDEEIPIFVADYVLASYGTGAIMAVPAHDKRDHEFAEKFGVEIREVVQPPKGPVPAKAGIEEKCYTGDGVAINSGEFDGLKTPEFKKKIIEFLEEKKAGKQAINYKLRDWIFSRQRYWGEPIPIVHCDTCGAVAVPEKDLPLELPDVKNYEPTDTGESPLASITDWVNVACPKCGEPAKRETDTMPNWAGSSWYFLRYTDPQNSEEFASKEKLKYWTPIDLYNGGMEHTVLHLLYSRFWHKFLYDQKLVPTSEPYAKRISHGMILGPDNEKMSKSRGNVVNPDEIIEKFGADTLRLYEMFIGPFDQAAAWSEGGVEGARRFLDKIERLSEKVRDSLTPQISGGLTLEKSLHKTIKKVSEDLEHFHFNTAISALMIFVNDAQQLPKIPQETFEKFLTILA
ncbi:MAG: leucine--tRNA ligase, partial [Patescibacteria group bacterium]